MRSEQSWEIGDLTDLEDLAVWSAAEHQADFVLVNPLHASEPVPPIQPSPYLPSSRRFANPSPCDWNASRSTPWPARLSEEIDKIRIRLLDEIADSTQIDRDRSWNAKREALEIIFSVPRTPGREASFAAYRRRGGVAWRDSPPGRRSRKSTAPASRTGRPSCRLPSRELLRSSLLHMPQDRLPLLVAVADGGAAGRSAGAQRAGMALGVMHDLPVGVSTSGADAWSLQDSYATSVSVGCPPDPFNQIGQDWNQPPWRPDRLAATAYAPFRGRFPPSCGMPAACVSIM